MSILKAIFSNKEKVKDVIKKKVKFIFILESPEKTEVIEKLPAVGSAGKAMSEKLLGKNDEGLGKKIKNNSGNAKYFGIMNVCQYPLQSRIITEYIRKIDNNDKLDEFLEEKADHLIEEDKRKISELTKEILKDFCKRIKSYCKNNSNVIFIPCGKFATAFFEECINNLGISNNKIIYPNWAQGIPHPSRGNWSKKKYEDVIGNMIDEI